MAIFHYKTSPLIDRIEVRTPHPGIAQATIVARKDADLAQLETLRKALGERKFSTLMDTVDGHTAIQVRGLKNEKILLNALNSCGYGCDSTQKEITENDTKKVSYREKVRGKALFLSAIFYDLGNAAFFASGIQRGRHNKNGKFTANDISEMLIGGAFSVGDVLMTAYGADKGDEELSAAAQGLKRHLHQKGIEIPKGDDLSCDTLHESGALKATDRWLRKNIIQIKCLSEFAGGLFTIHAGLKPGNVNRSKIAAGLLISTGWLATLLLDKPRGHHIFEGDKPAPANLAGQMADNPRGWIARPLAMGNNVANLWGALNPKDGERTRFKNEVLDAQKKSDKSLLAYAQTKQHDYAWNVLSACSFLVAHVLFGISGSKRPADTDDDKIMRDDLVLLSANILAKQPEKVRQIAIAETADYISRLSHVKQTAAQVEEAIQSKVNALSESTWLARAKNPVPTGQLSV